MFIRASSLYRLLVVVLLLAGFSALSIGTSAQGTSEAAKACQKGGYMDVHGAANDGGAIVTVEFKNVGDCVSYVAQGGKLYEGLGAAPGACQYVRDGGRDLALVDLSTCDFSGMDLSGADLREADLTNAVLTNADLSGIYAPGADLSGADLRGANLFGAVLNGAILVDADLSRADLSRADLRLANLFSANMTNTILDRVIWGDTTCPDGQNSDLDGTCVNHI